MKQVNLNDFIIVPIEGSIRREKISDEIYFSSKYKYCTSNSKLRDINPEQGGSPKIYFEGSCNKKSSSLNLGSGVHQLILEQDEFFIPDELGRPTEKLGDTIDRIKYYRKKGYSIYDSIINASKDCDYYVNTIDTKIHSIIEKGFEYYWKSKDLPDNAILLPDKDRTTCLACVKSILHNQNIMNKLHPTDLFGDEIPTYNEDAFFADFVVYYNGKATVIPFKMKIDNWTIDVENKILTLNDLKTTRKSCKYFMAPGSSFETFHYARQFGIYSDILKRYAEKQYGFDSSWTFKSNVFVVETTGENSSACYSISNKLMDKGLNEFNKLMKMVGYYAIFGYNEEVEFIEN